MTNIFKFKHFPRVTQVQSRSSQLRLVSPGNGFTLVALSPIANTHILKNL